MNYTHVHVCTWTLTTGQINNKHFLSHLPHSVSSTYASYSKTGQKLRPSQRVHRSCLFILLAPQESYFLASTVFCLSLHKHLEVISTIFHSQLVRATELLWTLCSSAVIFPPRWPYTCSHQNSLWTTTVPLEIDFWKEAFTTIIYLARQMFNPALRCEILLRADCSDIPSPTGGKRDIEELFILKLLTQCVFQIILIGVYKQLHEVKTAHSKGLT